MASIIAVVLLALLVALLTTKEYLRQREQNELDLERSKLDHEIRMSQQSLLKQQQDMMDNQEMYRQRAEDREFERMKEAEARHQGLFELGHENNIPV